MSEVVVRLANNYDCTSIVELFNSEEHESERNSSESYTNQSIQNLVSNETHQMFVAEMDSQLIAVMITCIVDAGTTLVIKNLRIGESFKDTDMTSVLFMGMYKYMAPNFVRLRRERFLSSCKDLMKLVHLYSKQVSYGKFTKVFELEQQAIKIEDGSNFWEKLDDLVHDSCLVHLSRKDADLYILRNLSCFCSHTLVVDAVPYMPLLSSSSSIFTESEYLLGEIQPDQKESHRFSTTNRIASGRTSPALRVPTPTNGLGSGRNSPTRLQSSHLVNVLDSLHTSLQSMGENLQDLQDTLHNAKPKSFSHGRELSKPQGHKTWEVTIYCENAKVFRAHVLEQLRAATLRLRTGFTLTLNYNIAMSNEAMSMFTEDLGLNWKDHERKAIAVYERPVDFSIPNSMLPFSP